MGVERGASKIRNEIPMRTSTALRTIFILCALTLIFLSLKDSFAETPPSVSSSTSFPAQKTESRGSLASPSTPETSANQTDPHIVKYEVGVKGMLCKVMCVRKVRSALSTLPNVDRVEVLFDENLARIVMRPKAEPLTQNDIEQALAKYPEFEVSSFGTVVDSQQP